MTAELTAALDDLDKYIRLNDRGQIVVETILYNLIGEENVSRLKSCIEDNIVYERGSGDRIDYAGAVRDFRKAKGEEDNGTACR